MAHLRLVVEFQSQNGKSCRLLKIGSLRNRTAGPLRKAECRKMSLKIGNAQSSATFFSHSAVPSLSAVLLRKLPTAEDVVRFCYDADINNNKKGYGLLKQTLNYIMFIESVVF